MTGVSATAKDKPLPSDISIITEDQAKSCKFVDIVSAMRFAMTSASKTSRAALIAALEKAKAAGANSAVMTGSTVDHNQHQITLSAYQCPIAPAG
ncbi:hypothetical protein SPHN_18340 [Sphingomonas faeni]|nr:hypothetical protein [Sphingomonas faeni]